MRDFIKAFDDWSSAGGLWRELVGPLIVGVIALIIVVAFSSWLDAVL